MKVNTFWSAIACVALFACNSHQENNQARITVENISPVVQIELPHFEASMSSGKSVLTWRAAPDAGMNTPFFQIYGLLPTSGTEDPLWSKVAFTWPGVHGRPDVHGCGCNGTVTKQLDEVRQQAIVDLDLVVAFIYDGNCPNYCDYSIASTDAGELFIPPHPCDAGSCLEQIGCPEQSTAPILINRNDMGEATINYKFCDNTDLVEHTAHIVAHARLTPSDISY